MLKPVSMRLQFACLVALLGLAGGLWLSQDQVGNAVAGLTGKKAGKSSGKRRRRRGGKRAVPVIIAAVRTATSDENIAAVGTARARRSIMLHAKSDGVIMAFKPKTGHRVAAGETIFVLDTTQAELTVKLAEKRLQDARRLLQRQQQLKRRRVTSSAKVDDNLVAVERAQLELRQAQKTLKDQTITAPFVGVVGMPSIEVGDRVETSMAVVSLDMRSDLLVEFAVPERYATRIKLGDPVEAVTPGFADERFVGRIERIDCRIDPASRTARLRAVIPNKSDLLRPGMSFAVKMVLPGKSYAAVPELSLQWRKGESYVWIVRDKIANKVLVRTVQRQNSRVLIEGPVAKGDLVVVEGVQRLRHGRTVEFDPIVGSEGTATEPKRSARSNPGGKG